MARLSLFSANTIKKPEHDRISTSSTVFTDSATEDAQKGSPQSGSKPSQAILNPSGDHTVERMRTFLGKNMFSLGKTLTLKKKTPFDQSKNVKDTTSPRIAIDIPEGKLELSLDPKWVAKAYQEILKARMVPDEDNVSSDASTLGQNDFSVPPRNPLRLLKEQQPEESLDRKSLDRLSKILNDALEEMGVTKYGELPAEATEELGPFSLRSASTTSSATLVDKDPMPGEDQASILGTIDAAWAEEELGIGEGKSRPASSSSELPEEEPTTIPEKKRGADSLMLAQGEVPPVPPRNPRRLLKKQQPEVSTMHQIVNSLRKDLDVPPLPDPQRILDKQQPEAPTMHQIVNSLRKDLDVPPLADPQPTETSSASSATNSAPKTSQSSGAGKAARQKLMEMYDVERLKNSVNSGKQSV